MSGGLPGLPSRPPLVALPAGVRAVGFAVEDHDAVVQAASALSFQGEPEGAVLKRRAEFLAGRLAAVHALRALGYDEKPGRNADGSPDWPAQAVGSITHGAGRALCVVARRGDFRSLGIDAERLLGEDARAELRRRICNDDERKVLGALSTLAESHHISLAFSAKESLYKCLYPQVGKFMDFRAAHVVAVTTGSAPGPGMLAGELTLELSVDWSSSLVTGQRLSAAFVVGPGHVETVVALGA